jgi:hypothetical protein
MTRWFAGVRVVISVAGPAGETERRYASASDGAAPAWAALAQAVPAGPAAGGAWVAR